MTKNCKICGVEFEAKKRQVVTCSLECRMKNEKQRKLKWERTAFGVKSHQRQCLFCSCIFVTMRSRKSFCDGLCKSVFFSTRKNRNGITSTSGEFQRITAFDQQFYWGTWSMFRHPDCPQTWKKPSKFKRFQYQKTRLNSHGYAMEKLKRLVVIEDIPPELIALKREHLKAIRLNKQLSAEIKRREKV